MQLYRKEQRPLKSHGFDVRFPSYKFKSLAT